MSLTIFNNDNKKININFMEKTFSLNHTQDLWNAFSNLYYDKMVDIFTLMELQNGENLHNKLNNSNSFEFNHIDNIFDDIKIIIKKNLSNATSLFSDDYNEYLTKQLKENINEKTTSPLTHMNNVIPWIGLKRPEYVNISNTSRTSPLIVPEDYVNTFNNEIDIEDTTQQPNYSCDKIAPIRIIDQPTHDFMLKELNKDASEQIKFEEYRKKIYNGDIIEELQNKNFDGDDDVENKNELHDYFKNSLNCDNSIENFTDDKMHKILHKHIDEDDVESQNKLHDYLKNSLACDNSNINITNDMIEELQKPIVDVADKFLGKMELNTLFNNIKDNVEDIDKLHDYMVNVTKGIDDEKDQQWKKDITSDGKVKWRLNTQEEKKQPSGDSWMNDMIKTQAEYEASELDKSYSKFLAEGKEQSNDDNTLVFENNITLDDTVLIDMKQYDDNGDEVLSNDSYDIV